MYLPTPCVVVISRYTVRQSTPNAICHKTSPNAAARCIGALLLSTNIILYN